MPLQPHGELCADSEERTRQPCHVRAAHGRHSTERSPFCQASQGEGAIVMSPFIDEDTGA